jgi:hypothetical protein
MGMDQSKKDSENQIDNKTFSVGEPAGPGPVDAPPKQRSFFLTSLPFFILAHATHHILTALPQPMLPYIQQEFKLNYTRSATVTSAFALSSGAAQFP